MGEFLTPNYDRDIHNPFLMLNMERVAKRVLSALEVGERVAIFADYDADGVPAAAILTSFFTKIGFTNFEVYIPDRHNEPFGLNTLAIKGLAERGAKLLITVDCGSSNFNEVEFANSLGMEVIITDHHLTPEILPPAYAILNPKQPGDSYPNPMLCGAGVAYKLVQALMTTARRVLKDAPRTLLADNLAVGWEKWLLDLVAVATISDMVPLTGENRALAYFGLKVLRKTPRVGLQQLYRALKINALYLTEDEVGFMIGPQLNSASRMSHGREAYELLTTTDEARAGALVRHLMEMNANRKISVESILNFIESDESLISRKVLVAGADDWLPGVLGLAANKLTERHSQPVFLWTKNKNGEIKGSCRSDGTVNVVQMMEIAGGDEFFSNYGGHDMAGGFSLSAKNLPELGTRLESAFTKICSPRVVLKDAPRTTLGDNDCHFIDALLNLDEINRNTYQKLNTLAPFGMENPRPNFLFEKIEVKGLKIFGGDHSHLELDFGGKKAIGFFMAREAETRALKTGAQIDLLANLEQSHFRNFPELRLRIVDWRVAGENI